MSDGEGPHAKRARQDGTSDAELVDCRPYAKPGHSCGSCSHCLYSSSDEASDDDSDPEHVRPEQVMRVRQEGWTGRFSDDGKSFLHADGGWTELEDCRPTAKPGHSCGSCSHCLSADHSSSDEASDDDQPSDRSDSDSDSDVSQTGSDDEPALSDCRDFALSGELCPRGSCGFCRSEDGRLFRAGNSDDCLRTPISQGDSGWHCGTCRSCYARAESARHGGPGCGCHNCNAWASFQDCICNNCDICFARSIRSGSSSGSGSGSGAHAEPSSGSGSGSSIGSGSDFGARAEPSTADLLARVATLEGLVAQAAASVSDTGDTGVNSVAGYRFT